MKKVFFLTILLNIGIFSSVFSQKKWTLNSCINYAIENNFQIKNQILSNKISDNNLLQSKLDLLPNLNAGVNENFVFGRSIDPYTNDFSSENYNSANFQISSSLTLFDGLQKINSIKKSKLTKQQGEYNLQLTKKNITITIVSAYLNVLYANDLLKVARQQRKITEEQLDQITKKVEAGKLSMQNQYDGEAQLANEELNIVSAESQLSSAKLILAQLLEIEDYTNFEIEIPDSTKLSIQDELFSVEDIYNSAVNNMPEIKASEINMEIAEKGLDISRGGFYPRLSVSASFGTGYSSAQQMIDNIIYGPAQNTGAFVTDMNGNVLNVFQNSFDYTYKKQSFKNQIKDNASTSVGISLNIPIFNSYSVNTQVQNSKILIEQSKIEIEQSKKELLKTIQQSHSDAQMALNKYIATEKSLKATKISFDFSQERYNQGLLNITDYNISKNNLSKAEIELLKAKYDFIFKQKILNYYLGKEINF